MKYVIGIDEVGRGPLAGPVTLSAFLAPENLKNRLIKILGGKIKDSKQFSEKRRKEIYKELLKLKSKTPRLSSGQVFFAVSHISNKIIDEKGIIFTIKKGVKKCLKDFSTDWSLFRDRGFLDNHRTFIILLDGLLKAPPEFKNQKTIIGGDSKDVFIACASIVAKVRRDRLMCRLAKKYPRYSFEIHKGYGTALHYKLLKKHGLSEIHRKSFCKKISQI